MKLAIFALLLSTGAAFAAPLSKTDGNANYGCEWAKADNGNWLTIKGNCAGIPTITGGFSTSIEKTVKEVEGGKMITTERVTRADRGGSEVQDRDVIGVSFELDPQE